MDARRPASLTGRVTRGDGRPAGRPGRAGGASTRPRPVWGVRRMGGMIPDDDRTVEGDLATWQTFCLAYYEPIRRALTLMRVRPEEVDDLCHSFITRPAEKDFLRKYHQHRTREAQEGRRARFRSYLYRSLQHHVTDAHRARSARGNARGLGPEAAAELEAAPERALDPDAPYALDVLHQALGALRRHCERAGKPYL